MSGKSLVYLVGAALLASTGAVAQAACEQCGTSRPAPSETFQQFVCRVKGNAGGDRGGAYSMAEPTDCDPSRTGLQMQAFKNMDKTRSDVR